MNNSQNNRKIDDIHRLCEDEKVKDEIFRSLKSVNMEQFEAQLSSRIGQFEEGQIYHGTVVRKDEQFVVVHIGAKSEGFIPIAEFDSFDDIQPGDSIDVLLEAFDETTGDMVLSKRKADRIRGWENVINRYGLGDVVTGKVVRKIKGGLLVDIGVQVFLPASQVDIRKISDIGELVGRDIEAKIIKIDTSRRNIVLSRRQMLEEKRDQMKEKVLAEIKENEIRVGEVKNITDFGAFVDLGGIDGLLHIVDMSWQRVNHPSEIVKIGDKIEVVVLKIDRERERVSVGLKQKTPSPWENIEEKYPVGSIHSGKVVNIMPYGAFIQLEEGIEGLVHVSEMSWTRQINHPSEIVSLGDKVDIVILGINHDKKEISLGMKQTERNPWETLAQRYPEGTIVEGTVKNIVNYGAFVEIEEGIEGLLHVSDMSWTKKIANPASVVKKGDKLRAMVLAVDGDKKRVSLSLKHLESNPWDTIVPHTYTEGMLVKGIVTNINEKGVFVDIGEVEAFMPHSEVSHRRISAREIIEPGDELQVKILTVNPAERSIRLSLRETMTPEEETERMKVKKEKMEALGIKPAEGEPIGEGEPADKEAAEGEQKPKAEAKPKPPRTPKVKAEKAEGAEKPDPAEKPEKPPKAPRVKAEKAEKVEKVEEAPKAEPPAPEKPTEEAQA